MDKDAEKIALVLNEYQDCAEFNREIAEKIVEEIKKTGYRKEEEVRKEILIRVLDCLCTERDRNRILYALSKAFPEEIEVDKREGKSNLYEWNEETKKVDGYESITYRVKGTWKWY